MLNFVELKLGAREMNVQGSGKWLWVVLVFILVIYFLMFDYLSGAAKFILFCVGFICAIFFVVNGIASFFKGGR